MSVATTHRYVQPGQSGWLCNALRQFVGQRRADGNQEDVCC